MTQTELVRITEQLVFTAECAAIHKRAMMRVNQRREAREQQVREWMPKGILGAERFNPYVRGIEPKGRQPTLHEYRGKSLSIREWADTLGIGYSTLSDRIRRLGSIEAAIEFRPAPRIQPGRKADLHTFRGQSLTLRQWARNLGLTYDSLLSRISRNGGNIEAALSTPARRRRKADLITFRGKTRSLVDWAHEVGIDPKTLRDRLNKFGWPIERALTEPPNPPRRKPHSDTGGYAETSQNPLGTGGGRHETDFDGIGEQP
ncbi:hypothetical protein [Pelagibacterium mangrovi]|uniref:hypothetical protein n=1 Tax=Pelagibacterium mangrovi TaxID=3119828 RepID=UPI002FC8926D